MIPANVTGTTKLTGHADLSKATAALEPVGFMGGEPLFSTAA